MIWGTISILNKNYFCIFILIFSVGKSVLESWKCFWNLFSIPPWQTLAVTCHSSERVTVTYRPLASEINFHKSHAFWMFSIFNAWAIQPHHVLHACILIFSSVVQENLLACFLKFRYWRFWNHSFRNLQNRLSDLAVKKVSSWFYLWAWASMPL